jgi:hypothetical protein
MTKSHRNRLATTNEITYHCRWRYCQSKGIPTPPLSAIETIAGIDNAILRLVKKSTACTVTKGGKFLYTYGKTKFIVANGKVLTMIDSTRACEPKTLSKFMQEYN